MKRSRRRPDNEEINPPDPNQSDTVSDPSLPFTSGSGRRAEFIRTGDNTFIPPHVDRRYRSKASRSTVSSHAFSLPQGPHSKFPATTFSARHGISIQTDARFIEEHPASQLDEKDQHHSSKYLRRRAYRVALAFGAERFDPVLIRCKIPNDSAVGTSLEGIISTQTSKSNL